MARILVVSMPFAGHVAPLGAIAAELVRRGHEVIAYTGAKYHHRFTGVGATWLPWSKATDFDDADLAATFPAIGDGKGMRGTKANGDYVIFGTAAGQIADIMAAGPYDLLVTDQVAIGGAVAGQGLGIPWATVAVTPLSLTSRHLPPVGMPWSPATGPVGRARDAVFRGVTSLLYRRMTDPRLNALRAGVGLGPVQPGRLFDGVYSTDLVLAQGVIGLDYPRPDLPPYVHFVGRLAPIGKAGSGVPEGSGSSAGSGAPGHSAFSAAPVPPVQLASSAGGGAGSAGGGSGLAGGGSGLAGGDAGSVGGGSGLAGGGAGSAGGGSGELPEWWDDLAAASTVVHVTQGTLDTDPDDLIRPALAGLADRDLLVVVTTGGRDPAALGELPANARVAVFIPHDLLLPETDVMISNGGYGGVLGALQAGVPLVVAGASLDKPEVARRVAWSGAGINLRTGRPRPDRIAAAVDRIRNDPGFRSRARELSAAMTAAGGAVRAGDLIEQLLKR